MESGAMKRALELGLGLIALAGVTLPAAGADLGKAPLAPPPVVVSDWSGFYLGVGLGARATESDWTTTCLSDLGIIAGCPGNAVFASRFTTDNPASFDNTGLRVSGYAGYNWQFTNMVLGVEADFGWGDNEETHRGIPGTHLVVNTSQDFATIKDVWDASIRLRAGYLVTPNALIYVTGGATWIEKEVTASCPSAPSFGAGGWCGFTPNTSTASQTSLGWTAGIGGEMKFGTNFIARAEYRYSDYTNDANAFQFLNGVDTFDFQVEQKTHTAYVGISYLFK
jgi:outer membrane immunogenic protein